MGQYLVFASVYFGIAAARNMFVAAALCFSKRPQRIHDISVVFSILFDAAIVTIMTVYGTKSLFSPEGIICRDNGDPNTFKWWVIGCCCLVYGWAYGVLLCVGLTSLPLVIIFWCYYRK